MIFDNFDEFFYVVNDTNNWEVIDSDPTWGKINIHYKDVVISFYHEFDETEWKYGEDNEDYEWWTYWDMWDCYDENTHKSYNKELEEFCNSYDFNINDWFISGIEYNEQSINKTLDDYLYEINLKEIQAK